MSDKPSVSEKEMLSALRYFKNHTPAGLFDVEIKTIRRLIEIVPIWQEKTTLFLKSVPPTGAGFCESDDKWIMNVEQLMKEIRDFGKEGK